MILNPGSPDHTEETPPKGGAKITKTSAAHLSRRNNKKGKH